MAGIVSEGSGNKLDTELNLVPFIDLLSTLVLFLLLTAVWVQVAAIQASVDSKGKSTVSITHDAKLRVRVTSGGFQLTWPTVMEKLRLPTAVRSLDQLSRVLVTLQKSHKLPPATLSGDDSVEYGAVIHALDTLKTAGFSLVALSTD